MAEPRDDALRRRYRELATEEPSAALDDAIRAAARRAVSSGPGKIRKPGAARWAVPVSVAAVLFLSFGVVMRLEKEAPPIAEPTPSSIVASKEAAPAAPVQAPAASNAPADAAKEREISRDKLREQPRMAAPPALQKEKKDAAVAESKSGVLADAIAPARPEPPKPVAAPVAPPPPAPASPTVAASVPPPAFAPAPAPASAPTASTSAPAASAAAPAASAAAPQERAAARAFEEQRNVAPGRRDEATGTLGAQGATQAARVKAEVLAAKRVAEDVDAPWPDTADKKLERVEALRKAGRDKDADEAISRFRREHPDYRIPDAIWERIRPK